MVPVEAERKIPATEAFSDPIKFYEVFDKYERPALVPHPARNRTRPWAGLPHGCERIDFLLDERRERAARTVGDGNCLIHAVSPTFTCLRADAW